MLRRAVVVETDRLFKGFCGYRLGGGPRRGDQGVPVGVDALLDEERAASRLTELARSHLQERKEASVNFL